MHSTLRRSKAAIARVRPDAIINELTSLPRHYTAADRAHRTGTGPMASGRHDRPGRRPDRRRDHSMAERSSAYRCRNPDDQPHRGRSARQLPGRQFRPAGAALVDRAVRRSSAQRAIGGLFHIFHPTRGGREGTERRPNPRQRRGGMTMTQYLQLTHSRGSYTGRWRSWSWRCCSSASAWSLRFRTIIGWSRFTGRWVS